MQSQIVIHLSVNLKDEEETLALMQAISPYLKTARVLSQNEAINCLSEREKQLLLTLAESDSISEAAHKLYMSRSTACKHLRNIYNKLGVHSLHRALIVAFRAGIIE